MDEVLLFKTILLKGEAGNNIRDIEKTATSGVVDTYTVTLTDGSTTTFRVTNGSNISTVEKTATSGLIDTYTITLTDGSTTTFQVTNGATVDTDALKQEIFNTIYPVGAVYISFSSTSPSTIFGGTWTKVEGQFLLGASSTYTLETTGGEATHILTIEEMPNHSHDITTSDEYGEVMIHLTGGNGNISGYAANEGTHWLQWGNVLNIANTGGGQAHNNLPPYIAVNIWRRTA